MVLGNYRRIFAHDKKVSEKAGENFPPKGWFCAKFNDQRRTLTLSNEEG